MRGLVLIDKDPLDARAKDVHREFTHVDGPGPAKMYANFPMLCLGGWWSKLTVDPQLQASLSPLHVPGVGAQWLAILDARAHGPAIGKDRCTGRARTDAEQESGGLTWSVLCSLTPCAQP